MDKVDWFLIGLATYFSAVPQGWTWDIENHQPVWLFHAGQTGAAPLRDMVGMVALDTSYVLLMYD